MGSGELLMLSDYAVARVCHEANRALQAIQLPSVAVPGVRPLIEVSPPWEQLCADERDMTVAVVRAAREGATPEQLHERWMAERVAAGWRYGWRKDADERTHPSLVPYVDLPEDQRVKDQLFHAIVGALTTLTLIDRPL